MRLILSITGGQVNTIDTIAKQMNPQADVSNVYWWIAIIILAIMGVAYFVIKHYFKGVILNDKPHPEIAILDANSKRKELTIPKLDDDNIDDLLAQRYQLELKELEQQYPSLNIDPYQNMGYVFEGNLQNAMNYNSELQNYKKGMSLYFRRTVKDQLMLEYYKKVDFVLFAKGKKICSDLHINMTISGYNLHVYESDSRQIKTGKRDVVPDKNIDRSNDFYSLLPSDQEEYEYGEWQLIVQPNTIQCLCNSIVSGCKNNSAIPSIYVDARYSQVVVIDWKINGADIPEKGVCGKLKVKVVAKE